MCFEATVYHNIIIIRTFVQEIQWGALAYGFVTGGGMQE
jgi:hypothetical protein